MTNTSSCDQAIEYEAVINFTRGDAFTHRLGKEFLSSWYLENRKTGDELWAVAMRRDTQFSERQSRLIKSCRAAGHKVIVVTPDGILHDTAGLEPDVKVPAGAESRSGDANIVSDATGDAQRDASSAARITLSCRQARPPATSIKTLTGLIDHAAKLAREIYDACGTLHPIWLYVRSNGDLEYVEATGDVQDKDFLAEALRQLFKVRHAERYVSATESWTSSLPPDGEYGPSLASHPDCKEHVWLYAEDKERWLGAKLRIVRPKHASKPKLSKLCRIRPGNYGVGGRFTGLLAERESESSTFEVQLSSTPLHVSEGEAGEEMLHDA